jgi:tRNA (mo5U34)-methyltransferase
MTTPDYERLLCSLDEFGLGSWRSALEPLLHERLSIRAHGDAGKWRAVIEQLPVMAGASSRLDAAAVGVAGSVVSADERDEIKDLLLQLKPWRKGPFNIHGIDIDTEWRSDLKWDRLRNGISSLAGRRVLDVGCGNGYFSLRMRGGGAKFVLGIDPMPLFIYQFFAVNHFVAERAVQLLPLRLHELPEPQHCFDTTFSMGVLYHQRDPLEHLRQLHHTLHPGGELVLETLVIPDPGSVVREPKGRYARMRNVWHLPSPGAVEDWLHETGYQHLRLVDVTTTTLAEQRSTEWMPFESLAAALDPEDPRRTVEGWPAPMRAVFVATAA